MPFSGFLKPKPDGARKPMIGKQIITPGSANAPINFGFHDGTGYSSSVVVPVANVLTGTTIAGQAGTMPNNGTFNLGLGVSVPAGYYSGGTTANGKRSATGTTASSSVASTFTFIDGTTTTSFPVTVTGLTFKPSLIYLKYSNGSSATYITLYDEIGGDVYAKTVKLVDPFFNSYVNNASTYHIKGDVSPASVTNGGFTLPTVRPANTVFTWIAIE